MSEAFRFPRSLNMPAGDHPTSDPTTDYFTVAGRKIRRGRQRLARTTAETPTMRERLARNAARRYYDDFDWSLEEYQDREAYADAYWPKFVDGVDEDLREMLEPSEGMLTGALADMNALGVVMEDEERRHYAKIWQVMIQSILNETQD